jgi:hypothetical protein
MTSDDIAWKNSNCPVCGTEHRSDCPNKYETLTTEPCSCKDGCPRCDYLGSRIVRIPGHTRFARLERKTPDPIAAAEREVIASAIKWKLSNNQFDVVLNAYDVGAKVDELLRLRAAQVSKP